MTNQTGVKIFLSLDLSVGEGLGGTLSCNVRYVLCFAFLMCNTEAKNALAAKG